MASITITLTDTPTGVVAIHTDFRPAIGAPCSPAQAAALEFINRINRDWGIPNTTPKMPPSGTTTDTTITRGEALVLVGPQGSGKSTLARMLASQLGAYSELEACLLDEPVQLFDILRAKPTTLVIDGVPSNAALSQIKLWLTNDRIRVRNVHRQATIWVTCPNVILCCMDATWLADKPRRFRVVNVHSSTQASNEK
ncbi:MAG: AAA family ATPase [Rhodoferax sp.]|nr:ATP-binding cassette domain-containing protein [Rhodoferax sp.]MDP3650913.1 AAA family ATPase [Rhodoferax sp.]